MSDSFNYFIIDFSDHNGLTEVKLYANEGGRRNYIEFDDDIYVPYAEFRDLFSDHLFDGEQDDEDAFSIQYNVPLSADEMKYIFTDFKDGINNYAKQYFKTSFYFLDNEKILRDEREFFSSKVKKAIDKLIDSLSELE